MSYLITSFQTVVNLGACKARLIGVFAVLVRYVLDDGVLEIINVSFGDQGLYMCVARTPVDQDTAVAQLSVVGELWPFSLVRKFERTREEMSSECDADQTRLPQPQLELCSYNNAPHNERLLFLSIQNDESTTIKWFYKKINLKK